MAMTEAEGRRSTDGAPQAPLMASVYRGEARPCDSYAFCSIVLSFLGKGSGSRGRGEEGLGHFLSACCRPGCCLGL